VALVPREFDAENTLAVGLKEMDAENGLEAGVAKPKGFDEENGLEAGVDKLKEFDKLSPAAAAVEAGVVVAANPGMEATGPNAVYFNREVSAREIRSIVQLYSKM
jgi:hypothetical protein